MKPDTGSESPVLPTQAAFDATIKGGSHQNIATPFGIEKLEWCTWLPDGEKYEDIFTRFDRMYKSDRQTDKDTA